MWEGTHLRVEITAERRRAAEDRLEHALEVAQRTGLHVWTAVAMWFVADPRHLDRVVLDHESLAQAPTIGCYRCEQPWSEWLGRRRCTGEPR